MQAVASLSHHFSGPQKTNFTSPSFDHGGFALQSENIGRFDYRSDASDFLVQSPVSDGSLSPRTEDSPSEGGNPNRKKRTRRPQMALQVLLPSSSLNESPLKRRKGADAASKLDASNCSSDEKHFDSTNAVAPSLSQPSVSSQARYSEPDLLHMSSHLSRTTSKALSEVVTKLLKHPWAFMFDAPVDWKAAGLEDYPLKIKHPMDLSTVRQRLDSDFYVSLQTFDADVRLIWSNAKLYNPKDNAYHRGACTMEVVYEREMEPIFFPKKSRQQLSTSAHGSWSHRGVMAQELRRLQMSDDPRYFLALDLVVRKWPKAVLDDVSSNSLDIDVRALPAKLLRELRDVVSSNVSTRR